VCVPARHGERGCEGTGLLASAKGVGGKATYAGAAEAAGPDDMCACAASGASAAGGAKGCM
jgi:hypothetical protein